MPLADVRALGIDASRRKWVGVELRGGRFSTVRVEPDLRQLICNFPQADAIGIDMPIGLRDTERRECDQQAREFVGARRSSVFYAPPAESITLGSHAEATALATQLGRFGISQQAYALRGGIQVVAAVAEEDPRIIEVHPEVSFRALAGSVLESGEKSWDGQRSRIELLASAGVEFPPDGLPNSAGQIPADDLLDAAVAAWSAHRYAIGEATALPPGAKPGQKQTIWY